MISFKLILCIALIAMASAQDYDGDSGDFDGDAGGPDMGGFDSEAGFTGGMSGSFGGDAESGASFEGSLGGGEAEESRKAAASVPLVYKILGAPKN